MNDTQRWFQEALYPEISQHIRIDEIIFEGKTAFQDALVFKNKAAGAVLTLDGVVQTTERDEHIYHEMLTHVPMIAHGNAKNVLIIGGGDGGMLRHCLMHPVEKVTMVELDQTVVDLCTAHMPMLSQGAFEDPRAELIITDGCQFVKQTAEKYDVIIVDSTDPIGPGEVLFTSEFYGDCHKILASGGVMVTQNGVPFLQPHEITQSATRLGHHFQDVTFYAAAVPFYFGGIMTFGWASDDAALRQRTKEFLVSGIDKVSQPRKYYNEDIHVACFALPQFVKNLMP